MKAARLYAPGDLRYEEVDIPEIGAGEVLIRVKAVGICGSDPARVMLKGTYSYPTTVGHEFSGEVVQLGQGVKSLKAGDRVTIVPLIPCGDCDYCAIGEYTLCDDYSYYGSREDGAMAEFIAVKERNVLKLPDEVDLESGACTDPVSVALHAMRKVDMRGGDTVAVLGVGPIGGFAVQWARILGARQIIAIDIVDDKLSVAREIGADLTCNSTRDDPVEFVLSHTAGAGVSRVIEMAGSRVTQEQSIRMAKKQGRIAFCGISYDDLVLPRKTLDQLMRKEATLVGSWNSSFAPLPLHEWHTSLHFLSKGQIQCFPLISHRLPLSDAPEIFRKIWTRDGTFNKVLFMP
ncbi:MAG: galactitol-1-phosphate 5-dehydrogenase [Anaerolineales bacterium]|nr:MAG: galactitol-1-phosphate 5-dehydrogenase [Anaerolineales bacterium]